MRDLLGFLKMVFPVFCVAAVLMVGICLLEANSLDSIKHECAKMCYPDKSDVKHNTKSSDECYCNVDGELKLKKFF